MPFEVPQPPQGDDEELVTTHEHTSASPERPAAWRKVKKIAERLALTGLTAAGFHAGARLYEKLPELDRRITKEELVVQIEKDEELSDSERAELYWELNLIERELGQSALNDIYIADKYLAGRAEDMEERPPVSGFERVGLENEELEELWSKKHYPRGTIERHLSGIRLDMKVEHRTLGEGNWSTGAYTKADADSIVFLMPPKKFPSPDDMIASFDALFAHELGHVNDWGMDVDLAGSERVRLLGELLRAYGSERRFRTDYVENVGNNKKDPQLQSYYKVTEYWAEISRYYLQHPVEFRASFPREYEIAEKWLKKQDPGFDPVRAAAERNVAKRMLTRNEPPPLRVAIYHD